jgi:hypothetical protein
LTIAVAFSEAKVPAATKLSIAVLKPPLPSVLERALIKKMDY